MEDSGSSGRYGGLLFGMAEFIAHRAALRSGVSIAREGRSGPVVPGPGQSHPELRRRDSQMVRNVHRYRKSKAEPADSGRADSGTDDAVGGSQYALARRNAREGFRPQRTRPADRKNDGATPAPNATPDHP